MKLNPQDVQALRSAMQRMTRATRRAQVLEEELKTRSYELANWQREFRAAKAIFIEQSNTMGILETGTPGWEKRAAEFFAALCKLDE
jgi:hypothetical protein